MSKPLVTRKSPPVHYDNCLSQYYPFHLLSSKLQKYVEQHITLKTYQPMEVVVHQDDIDDRSVFLVKSGRFETFDKSKLSRTSESSMGPGSYFGERSSLFQEPRSVEVHCSGNEPGSLYIIPGKIIQEVYDSHETAFTLALASKLRYDLRLFDNFLAFRSTVQSTVNKSGQVDMEKMIRDYRTLKPAIHKKMDSNEVDYGGWSYALCRLPENICSTYSLVLSRKLLGVLRPEEVPGGTCIISPHSPGRSVDIKDRRRTTWELMPGKSFMMLREVYSDFLDVVTNLSLHIIESMKFRKLCKPLSVSIPAIQKHLSALKQKGILGKDTKDELAVLKTLGFSEYDLNGVQSVFPKGEILQNIVDICVHHGDTTVMLDPASDLYSASADELWIKHLRQSAQNVMGDFSNDDPDMHVHIISSNTHSVINCLSPYVHMYSEKILAWGEIHASEIFHNSNLNKEDLLYPILRLYMKAHPEEAEKRRLMEEECGIYEFPEKQMTGISTQLINMDTLTDADCKLDPLITSAFQKQPNQKYNGRNLLLNIDYCFGSQGQHIMRMLCLIFGKSIRSINVLGKAGGLTGNRGDILYPTHVLDESSAGTMLEVDNHDVDPSRLQELSGKCVHIGPVITVEGTLLQNLELLQFYERLWHTTGMEMEANWYLRAIQKARQLGIINANVKQRFLYYISDLPLNSGNASLATKMSLAEGVPPLYAITRHIVELIRPSKVGPDAHKQAKKNWERARRKIRSVIRTVV